MQVGEGELGRQGHVTEATERKGGAQTGSHPAAAKSHDPSLPRCQAEQVPPARPGHTQVSGPPENLVREPTIHGFTRHPHTPCPHMPTRLPGLDFRALQHWATSRPPGCLPGPLLDCPGPHCLCPPTASPESRCRGLDPWKLGGSSLPQGCRANRAGDPQHPSRAAWMASADATGSPAYPPPTPLPRTGRTPPGHTCTHSRGSIPTQGPSPSPSPWGGWARLTQAQPWGGAPVPAWPPAFRSVLWAGLMEASSRLRNPRGPSRPTPLSRPLPRLL